MADDSKSESTVDVLLGELELETASSPPPPPPSVRPKPSVPPVGAGTRSVPPPPPTAAGSGNTDILDVSELEELADDDVEFDIGDLESLDSGEVVVADASQRPDETTGLTERSVPLPPASLEEPPLADLSSEEFVELLSLIHI